MAMPDTKKYRDLIDDPRLTDEQKEELVVAWWGIVTQIVDFAYGDHPMQLCQKDPGKQLLN